MKYCFFTIRILWFVTLMLIIQSTKASGLDDFPVKNPPSSITALKEHAGTKENERNNMETRILFLCTANSCRSQMAEAWVRHLGKESVKVKSAGISAHSINPRAIRIMNEFGVDMTGHSSKVLEPDMIKWANLVVTVCGDADERCPFLPRRINKQHWSLLDPAKATGSDEEIMAVFRSISIDIRQHVVELLSILK